MEHEGLMLPMARSLHGSCREETSQDLGRIQLAHGVPQKAEEEAVATGLFKDRLLAGKCYIDLDLYTSLWLKLLLKCTLSAWSVPSTEPSA